jgi:hypothetical protein
MKIRLLLLLTIIQAETLIAQVSFCPPGANWRYITESPFFPDVVNNQNAHFGGRTFIDGDSVTVLIHSYFYRSCGENSDTTFLRQNSDTIFFRNVYTRDKWQVLFNFNAKPGHSWTNNLRGGVWNTDSVVVEVKVDSNGVITQNNFSLEKLHLTYNVEKHSYFSFNTGSYQANVTERFGGDMGIFNFDDLGGNCDGSYFKEMLCYQDPTFGLIQFSSLPCDYSNLASVDENAREFISISPNPTTGVMKIELRRPFKNLKVVNTIGLEVFSMHSPFNAILVDLTAHAPGLYFIKMIAENEETIIKKVIKQ